MTQPIGGYAPARIGEVWCRLADRADEPETAAPGMSPGPTTDEAFAAAYEHAGALSDRYGLNPVAGRGTTPVAHEVLLDRAAPSPRFEAPRIERTGRKYTSNPMEIPAQTTRLSAGDVVQLARMHWPQLSAEGARMLAAQWALETSRGANCYNFNFGNVKQPNMSQPHAFLRGTWELYGSAHEAESIVASANGLAHLATPEEKRAKGMPASAAMVMFDPPHPVSSFRAYRTADEGMAAWVTFKQRLAAKHPGYLEALNRGDVTTMARILTAAHYSTSSERQYETGIATARRWVDAQVGPS